MSGCANRCNSLLHHVRGATIITILRKDASFFSTILNKLNKENVQWVGGSGPGVKTRGVGRGLF